MTYSMVSIVISLISSMFIGIIFWFLCLQKMHGKPNKMHSQGNKMRNLIIIFMIIFSGCAMKKYDFISPIGDVNESYYEQKLSWWEGYDNALLNKNYENNT